VAAEELGFAEFYAAQYGRLRHLGYWLTGDWGQAEELAQEALVRTWWRWPVVRRLDRPGDYARKVLVNRHRSLVRRALVEARYAARVRTDEAQPFDGHEDAAVLAAALRRLSPRQRAVVVLRYGEDLSVTEVARLLGTSVSVWGRCPASTSASSAPVWTSSSRHVPARSSTGGSRSPTARAASSYGARRTPSVRYGARWSTELVHQHNVGHVAPWSARLRPRTPAQRRSRFVAASGWSGAPAHHDHWDPAAVRRADPLGRSSGTRYGVCAALGGLGDCPGAPVGGAATLVERPASRSDTRERT
jgi:RNA polymerase sigma factor (sigma-70 family)